MHGNEAVYVDYMYVHISSFCLCMYVDKFNGILFNLLDYVYYVNKFKLSII